MLGNMNFVVVLLKGKVGIILLKFYVKIYEWNIYNQVYENLLKEIITNVFVNGRQTIGSIQFIA